MSSFSAYLVGTYEKRLGVSTTLQIINPTTIDLEIAVAFYDDKENYLTCIREKLSADDMTEIIVSRVDNLKDFGVVKIISHIDHNVTEGIVGYQRHILIVPRPTEVAFSEAPLASIPTRLAQPEYKKIMRDGCH